MSAESTKSGPPLKTSHPITFLIIGGGIAGLSTALALRRVGHYVLVLERKSRDVARGHGGVRLPPNLTKILFHWGLKPALMQRALVTHTMLFMRYESGEDLGEHVWDKGMLKETRGIYMLCTHDDLYGLLYEAAVSSGAQIRYDANVVSINSEEREVTLQSGEKINADVLVGADGEFGLSRSTVIGQDGFGTPTGLAMYDTIISSEHVTKHANASTWKDHGIFTAFGSGRAIVAYPVHGTDDLAMQFYGPDDNEGQYGDEPSVDMPEVTVQLCDHFQPLMKLARKAVRVSIRDHSDLDEWISDDGPLVLIGEAAHPFPPGTIQATAMAVEDGAVLARVFSHLSEDRQIDSFLYAFQELRQPRTRSVRAGEFGNIFFMTLEDGEDARQRDDSMRAMAAKGTNVLEGLGGDVSRLWDEIRTIFGYDCEDEADDWWVQWGMLRERALKRNNVDAGQMPATPLLDFSSLMSSVQVTETAQEE
ncbi:FAD/NAD(P)-binding domain-containing protein [Lentinus tigrinus ALCF2SS1-6]|uniref:FAD/NAD(P)-binding domain-containing protein n=1 Tax=Lentinus tigrinus ALCF2SS1-6 TaxID=1328759 RepID=A0A5C2S179_9APHY|nr:FAD/NAD(P)-binding domain-containing protein [Lentinus tigrinus ALCF2SS1-6]